MKNKYYNPAERLSEYRIMWILVLFDLPTFTPHDRKVYTEFRKKLLESGFTMFQFSIYQRPCSSRENMEMHVKRIEKILPQRGKIGIMAITDKQFSEMKLYYGRSSVKNEDQNEQLLLF